MSNGDNLTKQIPMTRATPEMHAAVKRLAKAQDRSICAIVRAALAAYIREANDDEQA